MISYVRRFIKSIKLRKKSFKVKARYKELKDKMKPSDDYEELIVLHRAKMSSKMIFNANYKHAIFGIKNLIDEAIEKKNSILVYGCFPNEVKEGIFPLLEEAKKSTSVDIIWNSCVGIGFITVEASHYLYAVSGDRARFTFGDRYGIAGELAREFKYRKSRNEEVIKRRFML